MINLIPTDLKSSYIYAKRNVVLKKWVTMFVFAIIGLGILGTYGLLAINQSSAQYNSEISKINQTFKNEKFSETQKEVQNISNNFKLVVKVLSQEVLFSQLLKQIASTIPANANLTGLNISQTTGGIDIAANAIDYRTATQVQVNLADPANKIFSKADIVSITCNSKNDVTTNAYPCTVNIRALFATENPFLFINNKAAKP